MGIASVRWSDSSYVPGKSAVVAYDVVAASELEAIAACGVGTGASHQFDGDLFADDPRVSRPGFNLFRVEWQYKPQDPTSIAGMADPLKQPPRLSWRIGVAGEAKARDAKGNAYRNAAEQPIDPPPTVNHLSIFLTVTRTVANFDLQRAFAHTNKTNSKGFVLLGRLAIAAGQMYCEGITPGGEYTSLTKYVDEVHSFELRADGFKLRLMNKGRCCFYRDDVLGKTLPGPICSGGEPVGEEAYLDPKGVPIETGYQVKGRDGRLYAPVAAPRGLSPDVTVERNADGTYSLLYPQYGEADFTRLF